MTISRSQLAFFSDEYKPELKAELQSLKANILLQTARFAWIDQDLVEPAWAQGIWRDVKRLEITSIADAQAQLKSISPTWRYYGDLFHRRGELIAQRLNTVLETPEYHFTAGVVKKMPPAFTILEPNLILYSFSLSRPSLDGIMSFKESKNPPSRAYLKLWEALTIIGDWPQKQSQVVDLGSSPGSWTWALAKLGAQVLSIDRSPLAESLSTFTNIDFQKGDAFARAPEKKDWVFSDVICYPEKLLSYVKTWIDSGLCEKFVCSVKFAGTPDHEIVDQFRKLPNSRIIHLTHNKNEVTWMRHPKIKTMTLV